MQISIGSVSILTVSVSVSSSVNELPVLHPLNNLVNKLFFLSKASQTISMVSNPWVSISNLN